MLCKHKSIDHINLTCCNPAHATDNGLLCMVMIWVSQWSKRVSLPVARTYFVKAMITCLLRKLQCHAELYVVISALKGHAYH